MVQSPGAPDRPEHGAPRSPTSLDRVFDLVSRLCMVAAGTMLTTLIAIMGWLVFGRYVLNDTPTWVEQASLLLVVWITFLGAAVGVREETHLGVDMVREALPERPRHVLRVAADLVVVVFGGLMAWQGWLLVETNLARPIPMIGLAESWRAAPLAVCGALMVLFGGARLAGRLSRGRGA